MNDDAETSCWSSPAVKATSTSGEVFQRHCQITLVPSVLWHCWLGVRKSIWPVKIEWWGVDVVICLEWGADCLHVVQLMPLPSQNSVIFCLSYIQTGFTFWYQLTQVVLEKRPLNGCSGSGSGSVGYLLAGQWLVYYTDRPPLSAAWFHHVGSSATAGACLCLGVYVLLVSQREYMHISSLGVRKHVKLSYSLVIVTVCVSLRESF